MTPMSEAQRLHLKERQIERRRKFVRAWAVSAAIWALLASIFLLDIFTPPDNVSVPFAYAIPILVESVRSTAARHPLRSGGDRVVIDRIVHSAA